MVGVIPNPLPTPSPIIVSWWGASGTKYDFQLDPIGTRYKQRAGVYVFAAPTLIGSWTALYVGETGDFDVRIGNGFALHDAWPGVLRHGGTHIGTLFVAGSDALRKAIEKDLIQGLSPVLNTIHKL